MIRLGVLTVSDSCASGAREDRSGPALAEHARSLGWTVAADAVVADDVASIGDQLRTWADSGAIDVILTTGGTGVAARDVTPEATRAVLDREVPGLAELMRAEGLKSTRFAALSRGLAGTRGATLIVNLPGSPRGAIESMNAVAGLVSHVVDLLQGRTEHQTKPNAQGGRPS